MEEAPDLNDHAALVRFRAYANLSQAELGAMMPMVIEPRQLPRGALLQEEGERTSRIYLLLQGWTASSIMVPDGKRQILKIHLAGDLIGLPSLAVTEAPDTIVALTDIVFGQIDLNALGDLFRDNPRVAALLFLIAQEERLMLMDRLTLVGRRDTAGRLAGMLLQLHSRMLRQNPDIGDTLQCPLTQADLADMIGVTLVHINRTLMDFKERGIVTWTRQKAVIHDKAALRRIAGLPERVIARDHRWLPEERYNR